VKYIQNEEYLKGGDGRDEWSMKVGLEIPGMEWRSSKGIADLGKIHPRTNREGLALLHCVTRVSGLSAPGMELASPPKLFHFQFATLEDK